jgi:hypothetical protein
MVDGSLFMTVQASSVLYEPFSSAKHGAVHVCHRKMSPNRHLSKILKPVRGNSDPFHRRSGNLCSSIQRLAQRWLGFAQDVLIRNVKSSNHSPVTRKWSRRRSRSIDRNYLPLRRIDDRKVTGRTGESAFLQTAVTFPDGGSSQVALAEKAHRAV